MLNKLNSLVFYSSFFLFLVNIIVYFMGFIQILDALYFAFILFGFIGLSLGLKLTKNTPGKLKVFIVGFILFGSIIWILSVFKLLDFAIYWKYALLFIFGGVIWAIWNKVFLKGNKSLRVVFAFSTLFLMGCTVLTCFSFFDNSEFLFYSLLAFTISSVLIIVLDKRNNKKQAEITQ